MTITDFAISFKRVVFPAFGCATIIPLCPLPIGESKSTILIALEVVSLVARCILSSGNTGVKSSKFGLFSSSSGDTEFTVLIYNSAANFSVAVLIFFTPDTTSPVLSPNFFICVGATYTSLSPGKKFSHLIKPKPSGIISSIPSATSPESRSLKSVL